MKRQRVASQLQTPKRSSILQQQDHRTLVTHEVPLGKYGKASQGHLKNHDCSCKLLLVFGTDGVMISWAALMFFIASQVSCL